MGAAGAAVGSLAQKLHGSGIDAGFLEDVQGALGPGTSALVLLTSDADPDAVREFAQRGDCRLIQAELDPESAARLAGLAGLPGLPGLEGLDWPDPGDATTSPAP